MEDRQDIDEVNSMKNVNSFAVLAQNIRQVSDAMQRSVASAINKHLTARNWLIGYYIVHYEQQGKDRAQYGTRLLQTLAESLKNANFSFRNLYIYRQFYLGYKCLLSPIKDFVSSDLPIVQTLSALLPFSMNSDGDVILQTSSAKSVETGLQVNESLLFSHLSFSHFVQLLSVTDPLERTFYEMESIKGTWSVRELKRLMGSLYFQRSGLSRDKSALSELVGQKVVQSNLQEIIKSPFTFEFLGLNAKDVVEESDLETALMDHLQEFLLELGVGFCFEARQKRILIDSDYYFYDLLFYHRLLHCGVILELKSHPLDYKDVAQLNMYLAYYRKNMMVEGDNPPVGILLCTDVKGEMVEYATAGIDRNLFVSKYMLQLPSKDELTGWMRQELQELHKK